MTVRKNKSNKIHKLITKDVKIWVLGDNMSTETCKIFLDDKFGVQEWKRISKKKDAHKNELRVFESKDKQKKVLVIETPSGDLSIVDINTIDSFKLEPLQKDENYNKEMKESFHNFLKTGSLPTGNELWFNQIPSMFEYSFQEGMCCDHEGVLENIRETKNLYTVITGLGIFISPKPQFRYSSVCHIEDFIKPFLPSFISEVQEMCFAIYPQYMTTYDDERLENIKNGSIPTLTLNDLFNYMKEKGFTYNKKRCELGSIKKWNYVPYSIVNTYKEAKDHFAEHKEFIYKAIKSLLNQFPEYENKFFNDFSSYIGKSITIETLSQEKISNVSLFSFFKEDICYGSKFLKMNQVFLPVISGKEIKTNILNPICFDYENCDAIEYYKESVLFCAGGDWEYPVYFFIYINPKNGNLETFFPTGKGNSYNPLTATAFGSEDEYIIDFSAANSNPNYIKKWGSYLGDLENRFSNLRDENEELIESISDIKDKIIKEAYNQLNEHIQSGGGVQKNILSNPEDWFKDEFKSWWESSYIKLNPAK